MSGPPATFRRMKLMPRTSPSTTPTGSPIASTSPKYYLESNYNNNNNNNNNNINNNHFNEEEDDDEGVQYDPSNYIPSSRVTYCKQRSIQEIEETSKRLTEESLFALYQDSKFLLLKERKEREEKYKVSWTLLSLCLLLIGPIALDVNIPDVKYEGKLRADILAGVGLLLALFEIASLTFFHIGPPVRIYFIQPPAFHPNGLLCLALAIGDLLGNFMRYRDLNYFARFYTKMVSILQNNWTTFIPYVILVHICFRILKRLVKYERRKIELTNNVSILNFFARYFLIGVVLGINLIFFSLALSDLWVFLESDPDAWKEFPFLKAFFTEVAVFQLFRAQFG